MDGCGLKKICFIYRYYHPYLHKFRFVCLSKFQSINPRRKLLTPDAALEDLSIHQFCTFAARHKASNTFEGATRSCSSSDFLNSGHSAPDTYIPQVFRSAESGIPYRAFTRSSKRTAKRVPTRPICLFRVICGAAPDTIAGINVRLL